MADTDQGLGRRPRRAVTGAAKAVASRAGARTAPTGTTAAAKKAAATKAPTAPSAAHKDPTNQPVQKAPTKSAAQKAPARSAAQKAPAKSAAQKATAKQPTVRATSTGAGKQAAAKPAGGTQAAGKQPGPAKKSPAKQAAGGKKTSAPKTPAAKTPAAKTRVASSPATKASGPKTPAAKRPTAKSAAAQQAAAQQAAAQQAAASGPPARRRRAPATIEPSALVVRGDESPWTEAELGQVRDELHDEIDRLTLEINEAEVEMADLLRDFGDGAGEDPGDAGSKAFEREHEMSLANNAREMLDQAEHALARIDNGTYGICESCGNPIGKMRLQAFPRATLCMTCKQREERR